MAGELIWDPPSRPILKMLNAPTDTNVSMMRAFGGLEVQGRDVGEPLKLLHGLVDGNLVTLVGLDWRGTGMGGVVSSLTVSVQAALFGVHLDRADEAWFRRARISVPELPLLLGEWPIAKVTTPRPSRRSLAVALTKARRTWTEDGLSVTWESDYSTSFDPLQVSLKSEPVAIFESSKPRSLEWWLGIIQPHGQLVAASTGRPSRPRTVTLWHKKNLSSLEHRTTRIEVWGPGLDPDAPDIDQNALLGIVSAKEIDNHPRGLHGVLDAMRKLAREQQVFLSLVEGLVYLADRPDSNLFIDAVVALEAFDGKRSGKGPLGKAAYKTQQAAAVAAMLDAGVSDEHRKFIKRWLPGESFYSLPRRLRRLLELVPDVVWTVRPEAVARLRNDLVHGNSGYDDSDDLKTLEGTTVQEALPQVMLLARKLIAHELGTD